MSDSLLADIGSKLWSVGRLAIPGVALFELFNWLFYALVEIVTKWVDDKVNEYWTLIKQQINVLSVDLAPSAAFMGFIAKANALIPLQEMWHYFLLYLGVASVLLGVKWVRNLIPGVS